MREKINHKPINADPSAQVVSIHLQWYPILNLDGILGSLMEYELWIAMVDDCEGFWQSPTCGTSFFMALCKSLSIIFDTMPHVDWPGETCFDDWSASLFYCIILLFLSKLTPIIVLLQMPGEKSPCRCCLSCSLHLSLNGAEKSSGPLWMNPRKPSLMLSL